MEYKIEHDNKTENIIFDKTFGKHDTKQYNRKDKGISSRDICRDEYPSILLPKLTFLSICGKNAKKAKPNIIKIFFLLTVLKVSFELFKI